VGDDGERRDEHLGELDGVEADRRDRPPCRWMARRAPTEIRLFAAKTAVGGSAPSSRSATAASAAGVSQS
jgi:hypothetical protein